MKYIILIILCAISIIGSAQTTPVSITTITPNRQYCYDEAGNRICRYPFKYIIKETDDEYVAAMGYSNNDENEKLCIYESEVKIYPIPNNGQFTIELLRDDIENITAEIYSLQGEQIYSKNLHEKITYVSGVTFTPGSYILTLSCDDVKLDWTIIVNAAN